MLLTTSGSYPGEDLLGTFRACSDPDAVAQIRSFTGEQDFSAPVAMKAALLRRLEKAGVTCWFYTRAVAPLLKDGAVCGLLLACPNGLVTRSCSMVLDATQLQAPSFQAAGVPLFIPKGTVLPVRTVLQTSAPLTTSIEGQYTDLFDSHRLHIVRSAVLPENMTPTQATDFLMAARANMLRQLQQHPEGDSLCC